MWNAQKTESLQQSLIQLRLLFVEVCNLDLNIPYFD